MEVGEVSTVGVNVGNKTVSSSRAGEGEAANVGVLGGRVISGSSSVWHPLKLAKRMAVKNTEVKNFIQHLLKLA